MYVYSTLLVDGTNAGDPGNAPGLFGNITRALVQNVNLEDSYICVKGNAYHTGGIVSNTYESDIINCNSSVVIENRWEDGGDLGGIVGNLHGGTIQNCTFAGEINSENSSVYAGGIAGSASKFHKISQCVNKGKISNTIEDALSVTMGGIIGDVSAGEESCIEKCINESDIKPTSGMDVGGIAGDISADMLPFKQTREMMKLVTWKGAYHIINVIDLFYN